MQLAFFQIIGSASFFHLNPTVRLPITIGTYPIQDNAAAPTTSNAGTNDQSGSKGTSSASFKNDGKFRSRHLYWISSNNKFFSLLKILQPTRKRFIWMIQMQTGTSHYILFSSNKLHINHKMEEATSKYTFFIQNIVIVMND